MKSVGGDSSASAEQKGAGIVKVAVSARIIDRNVGGNSRYARTIYSEDTGIKAKFLRPPATNSTLAYAALESFVWPLTTRADVLHYPADTGPIVRGRLPIVTTIHGLGYRHAEGIRTGRAQRIWRTRVAASARVSDKIITVSESSAHDIREEFGLPEERVAVIPHGVDPKFSVGTVTEQQRAQLRRLGFPDEYMLYVGNIEPRKNLIQLVEAADRSYAQTGVKLVICGAPAWDFKPTLDAVEASEAVIYAGRLPEELLVPAYRGASLFCFPSKYEGFGLPVLEAMATGIPVACTRRGSLHEVADQATFEIAGLSADDITATLVAAMDDRVARKEMAAAGLARAGRFSWARSLAAHEAVFREFAKA